MSVGLCGVHFSFQHCDYFSDAKIAEQSLIYFSIWALCFGMVFIPEWMGCLAIILLETHREFSVVHLMVVCPVFYYHNPIFPAQDMVLYLIHILR